MKKVVIVLMFIALFQITCMKVTIVSAQTDQDTWDIQKVIKEFIESAEYFDFDSAIQLVSPNYYSSSSRSKNYNAFRTTLQRGLGYAKESTIDVLVSEIQFKNLVIQDGKASVDVEYAYKAYDLDTLKEISKEIKRNVGLAKEDGVWRITRWEVKSE